MSRLWYYEYSHELDSSVVTYLRSIWVQSMNFFDEMMQSRSYFIPGVCQYIMPDKSEIS